MVWYYVKDGARQGPVEEDEFSRLVAQSVVMPATLVWCEGMAEWKTYSQVVPVAPPPPASPVPAPEPEPVAEVVQPAVQPAAEPAVAAPVEYCSQCGKPFHSEEMVRFGTTAVCVNCKSIYAQKLRETGQVTGTRVYAGFWIRLVAVLIDGIALWIVNFALQTITGSRVSDPRNLALVMSKIGTNFLLGTTVALVYEAFFLVQFGATPGKMVLHLKVITPDGGGISWGRAIGRYFAKWLSLITLLIGYIMAGFDSEKRALHDYVAGTRVIKTSD